MNQTDQQIGHKIKTKRRKIGIRFYASIVPLYFIWYAQKLQDTSKVQDTSPNTAWNPPSSSPPLELITQLYVETLVRMLLDIAMFGFRVVV